MNVHKLLNENAVLPLWPETGRLLGLSRSATYQRAEDGTIKTVSLGRLKKVPTAWLRRKLELEEPDAARGIRMGARRRSGHGAAVPRSYRGHARRS